MKEILCIAVLLTVAACGFEQQYYLTNDGSGTCSDEIIRDYNSIGCRF